ncbi:MAG: DUF4168 domain-containing protein [Bacteroidales bacterium]|nr:DUF4168 domain-containing protein [Bacteroidales bacterium]MCF8332577.1 DUF4168 domain-containing protein [Bacteroidales bacterium]
MLQKKVLITAIAFVFMLTGTSLNAQQDIKMQRQQQSVDIEVSDQELQKFVTASGEIQKLQKESRSKMQQTIKDNGLSMQRYSEIQKKKSSGKKVDMSKKEQKAFDATKKSIRKEQMKIQQKAGKILKKHGIDRQRYMKISRAIRQDKELQKRYQEMQGGTK